MGLLSKLTPVPISDPHLVWFNLIIIHSKIFLQSPHCAANRLQHVHSSGPGAIECLSRATHRVLTMCNTSSAYHVQHIECLSRATHRVLITRNTSSAYHAQHIECLSRATHRVLTTCNTSSAYHVQHIECLSRATHRVLITCNMSCYVPHGTKGQLSY